MLVRAGHQVRAFVRRSEDFQRRLGDARVDVVEGDVLDRAATGAALEGSDAVIHCVDFPPRRFAENWDALRHALEGLGSGRQFIFPGNAWVYKPCDDERIGPEHPKAGPSALGAVRADLERAVTAEGGTVVHLPDVYGPGVLKGHLYDMFVRALGNRMIRYPGDPDRPREFLYIDDAARALVAPLGRPLSRGADYTAPGHTPVTPKEFARLIARAAGLPVRLRPLPSGWLRLKALLDPDRRALRVLSYLDECPVLFDGTRIRRELGWSPEVGYADGVRRTVAWLREVDVTAGAKAETPPSAAPDST
jgi:nucleoside-diphosphate-sugar epimerase